MGQRLITDSPFFSVWECTLFLVTYESVWGCVTCGCHGDASEQAGRTEVYV